MNAYIFRDKWTIRFIKTYRFSGNPLNIFFCGACTGTLISILFSFKFETRSLVLFPSDLQRKQLVSETFKVTMPRHFAL